MKTAKQWGAWGLAVSLAFSLAGCGASAVSQSGEQQSAGDSSAGKEGVTISFMASQDWVEEAELELAEKFQEQTGIKVDYQVVPWDKYDNLLLTKLNTGELTDIFCSQGGRFDLVSKLNVEKNALDLSGESWAQQLDPLAAVEVSANGKVYGQPIIDVSSVWAIAYSKPLFEQYDLQIPTNYEEFKQVCDTLLQNGVTPVYECVTDGWHHVLWFPEICIRAQDLEPDIVDRLNDNTTTFAENETAKTILMQMKEMVDLGYWGKNYMSNKFSDAPRSIAAGEYAMTVANQGFGGDVNAADPDFSADDIGYFVIPLADNQNLNVNPSCATRFINQNSPHAEEARQYLEFLASDESLAYLTEQVGKYNKLPFSNAPAEYSPTVQDFYDRYPEQKIVFQAAVKFVNPQWNEMSADFSAMFPGEMTPDEVLQSIDKRRAEQAKAAKDPAWQ